MKQGLFKIDDDPLELVDLNDRHADTASRLDRAL
jgi:hypothetical protein